MLTVITNMKSVYWVLWVSFFGPSDAIDGESEMPQRTWIFHEILHWNRLNVVSICTLLFVFRFKFCLPWLLFMFLWKQS